MSTSNDFTKEMYKNYLIQRKSLDSSVVPSIPIKFQVDKEKLEKNKIRTKERYHTKIAEEGDAYREHIRAINQKSYAKKVQVQQQNLVEIARQSHAQSQARSGQSQVEEAPSEEEEEVVIKPRNRVFLGV